MYWHYIMFVRLTTVKFTRVHVKVMLMVVGSRELKCNYYGSVFVDCSWIGILWTWSWSVKTELAPCLLVGVRKDNTISFQLQQLQCSVVVNKRAVRLLKRHVCTKVHEKTGMKCNILFQRNVVEPAFGILILPLKHSVCIFFKVQTGLATW